jgi:hypothetical protein
MPPTRCIPQKSLGLIGATTIDTLISLGWLPPERADDINEIAKAFRRFAGRALDVARRDTLEPWNIRRS